MNKQTPNKAKILLVEDDLFVRDLYLRTLEKNDYAVDVAVDGEEGREKAIGQQYDLILLDIMLPKMNGLDLLRVIRSNENRKNTPVFLLTNLGQEAIIKEAFKMGIAGYFLKARLLPQEVTEYVNKFLATGQVPTESQQF